MSKYRVVELNNGSFILQKEEIHVPAIRRMPCYPVWKHVDTFTSADKAIARRDLIIAQQEEAHAKWKQEVWETTIKRVVE